MNLNELTSPVRIYWDLPEAASYSLLCNKISEELIDIKILFLSLRDSSSQSSPCLPLVLGALKGKNISLSLTLSGQLLTPLLFEMIAGSGVKTLLFKTVSLREVRALLEKIEGCRNSGLSAGVSFDITRENFMEIPDVVRFCLDNGIMDLVFPIQRLSRGGEPFCIFGKEREGLARDLAGLDYRSLRITIHDYFLWQVFYPETDYHEGGCQAANSMLYISPFFKVYPCPAMPMELGGLQETTLREIILSETKMQLRKSLLRPPVECTMCKEVTSCRGGCRGRAFALNGSLDAADPACR